MSIALTPVLEIPFSLIEVPSSPRDPQAHERWRRDRAGALGVAVESLVGDDHVPVASLGPDAWRVLLAWGLRLLPHGSQRSEVRLDGGLALLGDEGVLVVPQCCSAMSDWLTGLGRVLDEPSTAWEMLYIGHPWTFARSVGGRVELTQLTESATAAGLSVFASLSAAELRAALTEAMLVLDATSRELALAIGPDELSPAAARAILAIDAR